MPRAKSELKLKYTVDVTVRPLKFELSPAVAHYDIEKLSRAASVRIEVGSYRLEGHCPRTVTATIRKGMVTGLRIGGCEDCGKPAPALAKLLNKAVGGSGKPPKWRPVTVAEFFAQPDIIIQGTGPSAGCYVIIENLPDGRTFLVVCCPDESGRLACASMIYRLP